VPGFRAAALARTREKFARFLQLCQSYALKYDAFEREEFGFALEFVRKPLPFLGAEIVKGLAGIISPFLFAAGKKPQQMGAKRFARRGELFDPSAFDLSVSHVPQGMKEPARGFFDFSPAGIRIHFIESFSHRAAAPERNTKVVNAFGVPFFGCPIHASRHALHPGRETDALIGRNR